MSSTVQVRMVAVIALVVASVACATSGGGPTPYPFPSPTARGGGVLPPGTPAAPATPAEAPAAVGTAPALPTAALAAPPMARAVVTRALDYLGTPYRRGGATPGGGFDCSGLTQYVFQQEGITIPRTVLEQFGIGKKVDPDHVRAGDLLFFSTSGRGASHVGIALGDGSFVHAPTSRGTVRIEALSGRYWATRLLGARRVIR